MERTDEKMSKQTLHRAMHSCFDRDATCAATRDQRSASLAGNLRSASSSSRCSLAVHAVTGLPALADTADAEAETFATAAGTAAATVVLGATALLATATGAACFSGDSFDFASLLGPFASFDAIVFKHTDI